MSNTWKAILAIAAIVLVVFMFVSGYAIAGGALLVLLLVLGLGAALYKGAGPPER